MNKKMLITGMFLLSSLLAIGAEINGEIKEKTRNKYIIRETNVLADGEKTEKTNYGKKVSYYKDGRLVKEVGISGVSGKEISRVTYDENGYRDGEVLEGSKVKRFRHGFLNGKSEDREKGLVKEYNMGVYDGRVDESIEYKGYIYSNGVLFVEGSKKIDSNNRKKYLKNIIVKEDGGTVLPSKFTGAYYVPIYGYDRYNEKPGAEVTFYSKGVIKSRVSFDKNGALLTEEVYSDDNKKIVENIYGDGELKSGKEYDSEGLRTKYISNYTYYNGKCYTIITRYQDGIKVGYKPTIEKEKIGNGKIKVNILKGYYRAGIYTGAMPHNDKNDVENWLKVTKGKSIVMPAGIDNPIVIKERKDVENISTYTGYVKIEEKEKLKTLIRYEDGVKKEEINYVYLSDQYIAKSRKVYLPSGEVVKYVFGTDSGMYIKKLTEGNIVEFSMADKYDRKWIGKMKDGKFIGRWECYTESGNKLEEVHDFGVDGSSYKGISYFGDGSINSTFDGKRNKDGLLIDIGQQIIKDKAGDVVEVFIYGDSLSWNKDVIYKRYQGGKVVERETIKAAYGVEGSQFNYLNEIEEGFRKMVEDF